MTLPHILLVCGVAVLGFALRSISHPIGSKLSLLCLLATSYLVGFFLSGSVLVGVLMAVSWVFLPWLELLTRVRGIRLPLEKNLESCAPPVRSEFPSFTDLTAEFEEENFSRLDDLGWSWEEQHQFFRAFEHGKDPIQGAICLIDNQGLAFYYVSVSSRGTDGRHWTTWNYPFSYSLKIPPHLMVNRLRGDKSILQLLEAHRQFLQENGIAYESLMKPGAEDFALGVQSDLRLQIAHNLKAGVLQKTKAGEVRYSWRGLIFLWWQFLRDLVRFS